MAAAAHATREAKIEGKNKSYEEKRKQVCEELDDVDELLQYVLNVHSSATNGDTVSCKHTSCCSPGPVIPQMIPPLCNSICTSVTNHAHCIDKCYHICKSGTV